EIYGITTVQEKLELFHSIFNKEPVVLLNKVDDFIEKGVDIKRLTEDLIELLKESIIFEYTKDASLLHDLSNEEASMIIKGCTIKTRFKMIDLLMGAYDKYRFAANVGSYFEVCLLEMLDVSTTNTTEKVVAEPVITKKEPVKEIPQPQNVSRETFEATDTTEEVDIPMIIEEVKPVPVAQAVKQESKPASEVIPSTSKITKSLDNDFVLGLLVGATKPEKAYDMDKFSTISDYLVDLKWARFASLLRNATIVGSGNNYIVIGVDSKAEANEINEVDSNNEFQEFIVELLGKNKKIFGISKAQQNVVIQEFKDRMINGTLPEPLKIEDVAVEDKTVVEPTQEETILSLFGEENITITEE
ncbi:MAG: DNA polymerase III subunit gamma/tau, partial [Longicatena sp.]